MRAEVCGPYSVGSWFAELGKGSRLSLRSCIVGERTGAGGDHPAMVRSPPLVVEGTVPRFTNCLFFSFLAQRRPQALQSVLGPLGPFLHSGDSRVPA